jgi:hypothetical protein
MVAWERVGVTDSELLDPVLAPVFWYEMVRYVPANDGSKSLLLVFYSPRMAPLGLSTAKMPIAVPKT